MPVFAGASKPSTFIYRVAHNAALTWCRGAATYARQVERFAAEPVAAPNVARGGDNEAVAAVYAAIWSMQIKKSRSADYSSPRFERAP